MDEFPKDKDWLNKRWWTTKICMIIAALSGIEYSCVSVSLIYYLQDDVRVTNVKLWYSFLMAIVYVISAISCLFLGHILDQTRNLRLLLLIIAVIAIMGNMIYTLQFSVLFLLVGRCFGAFVDAARPVISG